jgi:hypothetical protein
VFAEVGAHLASSQIAASSASLTGVSVKAFAVRASVNSRVARGDRYSSGWPRILDNSDISPHRTSRLRR